MEDLPSVCVTSVVECPDPGLRSQDEKPELK